MLGGKIKTTPRDDLDRLQLFENLVFGQANWNIVDIFDVSAIHSLNLAESA